MNSIRVFLTAGALLVAGNAVSQITLTDGNSRAVIDPTSNNPAFLRGMNEWSVDGVNQVFQQWYWFRVGQGPEQTIDTISAPVVNQISTNMVNVLYQNNTFAIDITFTLIGGSLQSGASDIGEIVRVRNLTSSALDFHLFEYDDFDVGGTFDDDSALRIDSSSITQFDGSGSITVGTVPAANHWQIAQVSGIFDLLEDGSASTLSDSGSPFGPGDGSFALQWDRTIAGNGTFLMSKNKIAAVPEPATLAALGLGLLLLRRKRSKQ